MSVSRVVVLFDVLSAMKRLIGSVTFRNATSGASVTTESRLSKKTETCTWRSVELVDDELADAAKGGRSCQRTAALSDLKRPNALPVLIRAIWEKAPHNERDLMSCQLLHCNLEGIRLVSKRYQHWGVHAVYSKVSGCSKDPACVKDAPYLQRSCSQYPRSLVFGHVRRSHSFGILLARTTWRRFPTRNYAVRLAVVVLAVWLRLAAFLVAAFAVQVGFFLLSIATPK